MTDALDRGRSAFAERAWADAYTHLAVADRDGALDGADFERFAVSAYLLGQDDECEEILTRAHQELRSRGEIERAVRCAFWLGFNLQNKGEDARAGGWLARSRRLLEESGIECSEQGLLLMPGALQHLFSGNLDAACAGFAEAVAIGERFDDPDLKALARLGLGQAFIRMDNSVEGFAVLDEVMVAVTSDEVSPLIVGLVYCAVIAVCQGIFDVRRAQEWTTALGNWCESQPDLVPYRGQCLVHRVELLQLHGAWSAAMDEAVRARQRLSDPAGQRAVGAAIYQVAELHRLRGEFGLAEQAYREASHEGRSPHPGLAQMRLAQGQVQTARAAIGRVLDEEHDRAARCAVLRAYIDVVLADDDAPAARAAADELAQIAGTIDAPLLRAVAAQADGAVRLAEGDPRAALTTLRRAWVLWQDFDAPYEAGCIRVLIGLCCRALGDEDGAAMEFDAARRVFDELGAAPDVLRVEKIARVAERAGTGGLTAREIEVLRLVATGLTNRAIGTDLFLSEKTVARHVSNIFAKLDVSSRSAATAYAYEHGLV